MEKSDRSVFVGLDVGSDKVATVVARVTKDTVEILGAGKVQHAGMRKGSVVNVDATATAIIESVSEAERTTDGLVVTSILVAVGGPQTKSFNSHACIPVANGRDVHLEDVNRVIRQAGKVELPNGRELIDNLTQEFSVDDMARIKDPVGMSGIRLDARVHIVTGDVASLENLRKCLSKAKLDTDAEVLSMLAASEAVLTREEREVGVAMLDIGAGTIDLAIFHDGALRHTFVLPLGSGHITQDLAHGLKLPVQDADQLKIQHGCAMIQKVRRDELVELPGVGGRLPRPVRRTVLSEIIEPRAEEIFSLVRREILRSGLEENLGAGIVLTGGGARLDGLKELGEKVFQMPLRVGGPTIGITGYTEMVSDPSWAVAVGLCVYSRILPDEGSGDHESASLWGRIWNSLKEMI